MSDVDFTPRELRRRARPDIMLEGVDPVLAGILTARGIRDASEVDHRLARLAPVSALAQIDAAVALLCEHRHGTIIIVGDFDADGATSTALMWRCLKRLGFSSVDSLVPNRFDYGYGLSPEIVEVAAAARPSLIVTVDNGISSVAGVARARELGIDVLVTDHHLPPEQLPVANCIVNPNQPGDDYPSKHLAGVGVVFCLMAALARRLSDGDPAIARLPADYLDLVALGTVADVVALDQNNRILVAAGLARIRAGRALPGIDALLRVASRDASRLVAADLGFALGPRLNAAGRLEDMSIGIRCLMSDDPDEALALAGELDAINRERREIESDMQRDAEQALAAIRQPATQDLPPCVCLYEPHWHQGVVGLIASRIKEQVQRPVFAFATESEHRLKGSGRSIVGVHLRDLLADIDQRLPGAIIKFGGHAMAAGLTLEQAAFDEFSQAAAESMQRLFADADFSPALMTDGELPPGCFSLEFATLLRRDGVWGQQFPEPLFEGRFSVIEARIVGERHLKLRLDSSRGVIDAIAFGQVREPLPSAGEHLQLAYRLDVNEWRSRQSLQLIVEQWQVVESA